MKGTKSATTERSERAAAYGIAAARRTLLSSRRPLCPKKAAWRVMQPLVASARHTNQLADLHAGGLVARDDVRLHHDRHVLFQRHLRQRPGWAALGADDGREVAAAEAVHQVIADGEAALLNDARGIENLFHRRAVPHHARHGIERGLSGRVQVTVERCRLGADAEAAQHLA